MNTAAIISLAAVAAFIVTALLGFAFIPWLHKLKFGQTILDIGPSWHKNKQGTPTMGGFMFIIGTVVAIAVALITDKLTGGNIITGDSLVPNELRIKIFGGLIMALCFSLIGFIDDYIKVVKKRNLGLTEIQKTALQVIVCVAYLICIFKSMNGTPHMFIPFVGNVRMGWFFWIFGICVIYGTVNAVNFTDGVDGLCSSVTLTAGVFLAVIAAMRHLFGVSLISAALAGGCAGFLVWNKNPAKVMMGDTGSMFLGGMVIAISYALNCPLILLLVGIIYVIEGMSDVIQIGYFKLTHGKRIFKMAPIHHHFEMSGWSEKKVDLVFVAVNILGGIIAVALMYFGGYVQ
ncbi:MAG: phospho-N-acetylmuramoyl-pentapeptide-transferase [Clostridiales bacterium]|nr:phospho-N-acetylmuramoyl-pentapeptide-transferase [Clostridiales bacterium]